jgi:hypothetical protein
VVLSLIARLIGYFVAAVALVALGSDLLAWFASGKFGLGLIGQHWYALHQGSLNLSQAVVQRYIHPAIWDPGIVAILRLPTVAVFGVLGVGLIWLGRRKVRRRWF